MTPEEYSYLDAFNLGDLVRTKQVTPVELMQCSIELSIKKNKQFNFISYQNYDQAIEMARNWRNQGPFQGIPFLLKDADVACKNLPVSIGSKLFNGSTYELDSTLVKRFRNAGLIPYGRTTVPELCMGPTTESRHNGGPTLNAWVPSRSAGGSSGGSAVAVATGVVPIAHGNDAGGSIRIPASCNGIFGLKPSRGSVPMGPYNGEGWAGLNSEGVLSRTVRDSAIALDAIVGYEAGSPYAAPSKSSSYLDTVLNADQIKPLRIAVWKQAWDISIQIAPECIQAVDHIASLLSALGHHVEERQPPSIDFNEYTKSQAYVVAASLASTIDSRLSLLGQSISSDDLELSIQEAYEIGKTVSAIKYGRAVRLFHSLGRSMASAMQTVDLILTPTLTQLPAPLGWIDMNRGYWDFRERLAQYAAFLSICNASGQPAASIPAIRTTNGCPIGVQVIGNFGREDQILGVAAQLEHVSPWIMHHN